MADADNPGRGDVAVMLRKTISRRRRIRRSLGLASLAGCVAAMTASIMWKPPILLVWNASASAPLGLYRVRPDGAVARGDMVVARLTEPARTLAAERRYIPANVPLLKRVAATGGDRVCAAGSTISINGSKVAARQAWDAAGRAMPHWVGCQTLGAQELFLLMDSPASFDGRYFGVTRSSELIGRAELLWAKPSKTSLHA